MFLAKNFASTMKALPENKKDICDYYQDTGLVVNKIILNESLILRFSDNSIISIKDEKAIAVAPELAAAFLNELKKAEENAST